MAAAVSPPDFVGVGAQRSGTSWWFSRLLLHPGIEGALGQEKELHYFDRFAGRALERDDVTGYHAKFSPPGEALRGEWTPCYMHDFWTPRLLADAAPEARLLVLLRDPVERYRSGFEHESIRHGFRPERVRVTANDALARGLYHRQLTRLLEHFPRSRVLVLQYEQCVADPLRFYHRTLDFLGASRFDPGEDRLRGKVGGGTRELSLTEPVRAAVVEELRDDAARLAADFPEIDLALWPDFARPGEAGQ